MSAQLQEQAEAYFTSDKPMPVEVTKQLGSFYPVDKTTKEKSDTAMFKAECFIHDPSKMHPIFYMIYGTEQRQNGHYLATVSMAYFQGKYESRLMYEPCNAERFEEIKKEQAQNADSAWNTGLEIEVYQSEKAGTGFNHEAYLLDTIRNRPVLMDCWNKEKLSPGIYSLSVSLDRRKGKLLPANNYFFLKPHEQPDTQETVQQPVEFPNLEVIQEYIIENDLDDLSDIKVGETELALGIDTSGAEIKEAFEQVNK